MQTHSKCLDVLEDIEMMRSKMCVLVDWKLKKKEMCGMLF